MILRKLAQIVNLIFCSLKTTKNYRFIKVKVRMKSIYLTVANYENFFVIENIVTCCCFMLFHYLGSKKSYQIKNINKIIGFIYTNIIKFPKNGLLNYGIFLNFLLENVRNIIFGRAIIHHSHITGKIIGDTHNFRNQKVRENRNQISLSAHNLFQFDLFFF